MTSTGIATTDPSESPSVCKPVSLRSVLLGIALLPLNNYWIIHMELVRDGCFPTVLTLVFTATTFTFIVVVLSRLIVRVLPRLAFSEGEIVTVYAMLAVGGSLAGCDVMQHLVFLLTRAYWSATPANHWAETFHRYLPQWLVVSNQQAMQAFYEGRGGGLLRSQYVLWIGPCIAWTVFLGCLLLSLFSLNLLFCQRWIRDERLSFPVVRLPLALATEADSLLRSRVFWAGFALAGLVDVINGFNFLYPAVPRINVKQFVDLGAYLTSKPWNAVGWFPITLYPFVLGMGYLIPSDLALSCVFFFWFWKVQRIITSAMGRPLAWGVGGALFSYQQLTGAWIAVLLFSLYTSRHYLADIVRKAFAVRRSSAPSAESTYRLALLGLLAGVAGMVGFVHAAGMSLGLAACYFGLYLGLSLMIARIRAELGPPVHDMYGAGPDQIIPTFVGVNHIAPRGLTVMTLLFWINRESYRSAPMAHHFEGMKLASSTGLNHRKFWLALLLAGTVGGVSVFPIVLARGYKLGADLRMYGPARWFATEGYMRLGNWLSAPTGPEVGGIIATAVSFIVSLALLRARLIYPWLPLHPSGFVVSSFWAIHLLWFPLLLAWTVKALMQRYGGPKLHAQAQPFFYGLILGEFTVGAAWQLYGMVTGKVMYAFWI